jgi:hypothetical protein
MPARTKKRAKFDFQGRPFVWWVEDEYYLRIASLDKKFVVAHPLWRRMEHPPVIEVIGEEFPGVAPSHPRPCWFIVPEMPGNSMGRGSSLY